ncbi:MAG: tetratricopeptide repeat protein [Anaerolineaceae bacterium]|nr:tetratricopeptide repeat protein [Anaerolineaceae bacterium]
MTLLNIQCFGAFQVSLPGQPLSAFGAEKVRALLAYLAVESDRPHPRRRLAGLLWPDQPEERALHNLRQALSTLRKLLPDPPTGEPFFLVTPDTVQFNPRSPHNLDLREFQRLLDEALRHLSDRPCAGRPVLPMLQSALALYHGPFLEHFNLDDSSEFDEWAFMLRESSNQRAVQALVLLVDYHERRHEFELARRAAERLVELAPWDETAHNQVIRLLAQNGQCSAAQARYATLRRYLADQMGLEPSAETVALFEQVRQAAAARQPLPAPTPSSPHNLRLPASPFIGREPEQLQLAELLADPVNRLITLLGAGGMGKTRLALQVGYAQIGLFSDGVWFVPLLESGLIAAIADALQFTFAGPDGPHAQLVNFLSGKCALLILDSFEHIQNEVPLLAELLEAAPNLVFLVTSRLRLDLHAEIVFPVEGLEIPPDSAELLSDPQRYSAPALFLSRARRLRRDLAFGEADAPALLEICRLLDGMPLGLELAAATAWSRSLPEIAAQTRASLDSLSANFPDLPARHRSLRAVFDKSWTLLTPQLQACLARLSVFRADFLPAAAEAVADCTPEFSSALLDRCLLRQNGEGRLQIPEPIQPYAADQLATLDSQVAEVHAAHAAHYTVLLSSQNDTLTGAEMRAALAVLLPEMENLRQAWLWAAGNQRADLLDQALQPLHQFLYTRSAFQEAIRLFEAALTHSQDAPLAARLKNRLGVYYIRLGRHDAAQQTLQEGLQGSRDHNLTHEMILALSHLANLHHKHGEPAEAMRLIEELLALSQSIDHLEGQRSAHYLLARIYYNRGDLAETVQAMNASLEIARRIGNPLGILTALNVLGDYYCNQEQYLEALRIYEECLEISRSLGSRFHIAMQLNNLGVVHHMTENFAEATRYYLESLDICRDTGDLEGESVALCNLGEVATLTADYPAAQHYYAQALEIGRRIENAWTIAVANNNLGETLRRMDDLPGAWSNFAQGLRIGWDSEALSQVMESLAGMGAILIQTGSVSLGKQTLATVRDHSISEPKDRALAVAGLEALSPFTEPLPPLEDLVARLLALPGIPTR